MFEKKYYSVRSDFKTNLFCKLSFVFAFIFLFIFLFFQLASLICDASCNGFLKQVYEMSETSVPLTFISLSMILFFAGFLFYFFSCQFAKLEKIADEIENSDEFIEEEDQ